jgi:microcystin-dependent protein
VYNVTNNAKTELDAVIVDASTTITVPSGYGASFPDGEFLVTIWDADYASPGDDTDREIIYISTRTSDTLTIGARAQENTAQVDHAIGDHIALLFTAGTWDQIVDYVDTNVTTEACTGAEIDTGTEANKHVTPAAIADSYLLLTEILGAVYPVGCIYTSTVSTNPNTLFGFGTWTAFGTGRVLIGIDSGDTKFDSVEETGGAETATLAETNLAAHTHITDPASATSSSNGLTLTTGSNECLEYVGSGSHLTIVRPDGYGSDGNVSLGGGSGAHTHTVDIASTTSSSVGSGTAFSIMNPYIVVYFWKRAS